MLFCYGLHMLKKPMIFWVCSSVASYESDVQCAQKSLPDEGSGDTQSRGDAGRRRRPFWRGRNHEVMTATSRQHMWRHSEGEYGDVSSFRRSRRGEGSPPLSPAWELQAALGRFVWLAASGSILNIES